jgi:hypothetical protein
MIDNTADAALFLVKIPLCYPVSQASDKRAPYTESIPSVAYKHAFSPIEASLSSCAAIKCKDDLKSMTACPWSICWVHINAEVNQ